MLSKLWRRSQPAALPKALPLPLTLPMFNFCASIDEESTTQLTTWLYDKAQENKRPAAVTLSLNTGGGSVYHAQAIHDVIHMLNRYMTIHIVTVGRCMSGGVTVLVSVPVEQRWSPPGTAFMFHPVTANAVGEDIHGTRLFGELHTPTRAPILEPDLLQLQRAQERSVVRTIAAGTGKPEGEIRKLLNKVDRHFNTQEALEFGLIGHIL